MTVSWPELLFVLGSITLLLQLFPGLWRGVVSVIDMRGWGWRSYAVACALWITVLIGIKTWRDNREN